MARKPEEHLATRTCRELFADNSPVVQLQVIQQPLADISLKAELVTKDLLKGTSSGNLTSPEIWSGERGREELERWCHPKQCVPENIPPFCQWRKVRHKIGSVTYSSLGQDIPFRWLAVRMNDPDIKGCIKMASYGRLLVILFIKCALQKEKV